MIRNALVAMALGLAVMGTAGTTPAKADIDIDINIGYGGFYGRNISCWNGKRIVDRRFNRVVATDCKGSSYAYRGWRNGKRYLIILDARSGYIKSVQRIR